MALRRIMRRRKKREPTECESPIGSHAGGSVSSYALSSEELRDRQAERDLRLQLAQLAAKERRAEADKALVEERRAEAERALAGRKILLAHELSLKELDIKAQQVESSGGSKITLSSVEKEGNPPRDLVPDFREGEDIDKWFEVYEVTLVTHRIPEEDWGSGLWRHIPGNGRDALLALDGRDKLRDKLRYPTMKETLAKKYGFTPEDCTLRFRGSRKLPHQSWGELVRHFERYWMAG
ncbi:hypothetical protein NDU88_001201 [Pleurodeles waltl]|uniref:Uncharacterized protein n=1 Tax=Pleurodeles waltl TaxID=8319 RepID=A0AAV7Q5B4_PLEWA|nr:hypothetical protein NDU88_001201 [Pleurodeles waltl]